MPKLKVGDVLYRVYSGHEITVESVRIDRITPTAVWFNGRDSLAFYCGTRLSLKNAENEARTPEKAVRKWLHDIRDNAISAQHELERCDKWAIRYLNRIDK